MLAVGRELDAAEAGGLGGRVGEDAPDASFAGQQETFLNVVGIEDVLHKMKEVFASLYNDRAISYRVHKGFSHDGVALSAGANALNLSIPTGAVVAREAESSTALLDIHVGIPHARLAGLQLRERWADWSRTPFTATSEAHVSVWEKLAG